MSGELLTPRVIGTDVRRTDGPEKVTGLAPYAFEAAVENPAYLHPVQSTVARGRITAIDTTAAASLDGVLRILTHENADRLGDDEDLELWILQSPDVHFRGQLVGVVIAETSEIAREAAGLVVIRYAEDEHDAELLADHPEQYAPDQVNPSFPTDTDDGDVAGALSAADVTVDATYTTPTEFNSPMEPHATTAIVNGDAITVYDSTQAAHSVRASLAPLFGVEPEQVRVVSPYVGGGFGSKGTMHANVVLAVLAARTTNGRPVRLAMTRQQMFALTGYRTPTIQRLRLGATADGNITAIAHDVVEQTSRFKEFAEQTAVPTRMMYASSNRSTSHRLVPLDVPVPSWMRGPGETPGMFALEVAMDELAVGLGLDPVELRIRNEPEIDADTGLPFSSRNLVACLRDGAQRFGWAGRDPEPGARRDGDWLLGTGVASSTYPVNRMPGSKATVRALGGGRFSVAIGAADIGTGARTALAQIAADALGVDVDAIDVALGATDQPEASVAGGSSGTTSWGSAIVAAARALRAEHGDAPPEGAEATEETPENPAEEHYAMHAYGAQFAEVRVHADTGEVRIPRMLGVFAAGRIINPRTARSQFLGGMTMGISMALHEQGVMDPRFGQIVNHDFAGYHIATNADIGVLEAFWVEEDDPHVNPMGSKGIGEIGTVGSAAAIANATFHATGLRVRDLPLTPDRFVR